MVRFERARRIARPAIRDPQRAADCDLLAKAAILSVVEFSEHWLVDALEATRLNRKNGPPFRYLHGVLRELARQHGKELNRCLARTKVPEDFYLLIDEEFSPGASTET